MMIEAWHADSLAGPMKEMKKAFEAKYTDIKVNLTSGRSKELAERILRGDKCDVVIPPDPAVVRYLFGKKVGGRDATSWYVAFSANELVLITRKGNPLVLRQMADMAKDGVTVARVTSEQGMATNRTIEFIQRAAAGIPPHFPFRCSRYRWRAAAPRDRERACRSSAPAGNDPRRSISLFSISQN